MEADGVPDLSITNRNRQQQLNRSFAFRHLHFKRQPRRQTYTFGRFASGRASDVSDSEVASNFWRIQRFSKSFMHDLTTIHDINPISDFTTEVEILFHEQDRHSG